MPESQFTFTETRLRSLLKAPPDRRVEYNDASTAGLGIRVTPSGAATFSVTYRPKTGGGPSPTTGRELKGPQRRLTLGQYPTVTLGTARQRASEIMDKVAEGKDPAVEDRTRPAPRDVASVKERYIQRHARLSLVKWRDVESLLDRMVIPEWGRRHIKTITRADAHDLLDKVAEKHGPKLAADVRKYTSGMLSWAIDRSLIDTNPMHRLKRPDDERYKPRERVLSDEELAVVWRAASQCAYPMGPCVQLLALTGARRDNIGGARWQWVDAIERTLTVPSDKFKSRRPHVVPLSDAAWQIVETLPRFNDVDWLFRASRGERHINGWDSMKRRLDRVAAEVNDNETLPHWTLHDLRRTAKTNLARLRVDSDIRDRVLGHAKRGMDPVYDQHDYLDEKREALEKLARHVLEVVS